MSFPPINIKPLGPTALFPTEDVTGISYFYLKFYAVKMSTRLNINIYRITGKKCDNVEKKYVKRMRNINNTHLSRYSATPAISVLSHRKRYTKLYTRVSGNRKPSLL